MVEKAPQKADLPTALALIFAAVLPSSMVLLYFFGPAGSPAADLFRRVGYATGKLLQLVFPVLFGLLWQRESPRPAWPRREGAALGLGFGLAVAAGIFLLYFAWLRNSPLFDQAPERLRVLCVSLGIAAGARYLAVALFYTAVHSLFEEYYYRWFIFSRLRAFMPLWPAVALSSLAFMAHHVLLLAAYLPGQFATLVVPFSLCVAVGGGVWAWLYAQTRSLYASWLSHGVVDAALFAVGWDLLQRAA